eukprot:s2662_g7.t1
MPHVLMQLVIWYLVGTVAGTVAASVERTRVEVVKKTTQRMKTLGQQKQWSSALALLETLKAQTVAPTAVTCAVLVKCCACQGGKAAQEIFQEMLQRRVQPDVFTYSALIGACSRGSDFDAAMQHFREMQARKIQADVTSFSALLSACEKRPVSEAMEIFQSMKSQQVSPNHVTYSSLISCCEKASEVDLAWSYFREMTHQSLEMDPIVYNAMISACEKGRQAPEAIDLLEEMSTQEVRANVITFNAVISACEKGRMADEAWEIFQRMAEASVEADVCTYNALISAADKCRKTDMALRAFQDLEAHRLPADLITYNALISACRATSPELARHFFDAMQTGRLQPDVISYISLGVPPPQEMLSLGDVRSFTSVISPPLRGDVAESWRLEADVLKFYEEMKLRGLQMDGPSYWALLCAVDRVDAERCLQLCDEMRRRWLRTAQHWAPAPLNAVERARCVPAEKMHREPHWMLC